jgi:hypothetical protein
MGKNRNREQASQQAVPPARKETHCGPVTITNTTTGETRTVQPYTARQLAAMEYGLRQPRQREVRPEQEERRPRPPRKRRERARKRQPNRATAAEVRIARQLADRFGDGETLRRYGA